MQTAIDSNRIESEKELIGEIDGRISDEGGLRRRACLTRTVLADWWLGSVVVSREPIQKWYQSGLHRGEVAGVVTNSWYVASCTRKIGALVFYHIF